MPLIPLPPDWLNPFLSSVSLVSKLQSLPSFARRAQGARGNLEIWLLYKSRVFKKKKPQQPHMLPVCFVSELKHLGVCVCIDAGCRVMPKPTGSTHAGWTKAVCPSPGLHLCTAPPLQPSMISFGIAHIQSLHQTWEEGVMGTFFFPVPLFLRCRRTPL